MGDNFQNCLYQFLYETGMIFPIIQENKNCQKTF